ncbi:MAG: YlbF family regulator [Gemmatimonadota bacterium]|mgnify:CR=1 FL=1
MILKRAEELGRLVGQSEEYQALKRTNDRLMADAALTASLERLQRLQLEIAEKLDRGEAPPPQAREETDRVMSTVQASPLYQGIVVAQTAFDKLMGRVNDQILEGIKLGAESRIITLA